VILTEKGEQVVQQAIDEFLASTRGLIDYLGEEQTNQLIDLLSSLFRYFHEREANKSYASWNGEEEA
jgi:DNA-binding MarR family transcriptional regulator